MPDKIQKVRVVDTAEIVAEKIPNIMWGFAFLLVIAAGIAKKFFDVNPWIGVAVGAACLACFSRYFRKFTYVVIGTCLILAAAYLVLVGIVWLFR